MTNITGWSRGTWNEGAWGQAVPVRVGHTINGWGELGFGNTAWGGEKSTFAAMQGQVGTATKRDDINVPTTGLQAAGSVGSVTAQGNNSVTATGLEATGSVGTISLKTDQNNILVTGVSATGVVDTATVVQGGGVDVRLLRSPWGLGGFGDGAWGGIISLEMTASVGSVSFNGAVDVDVTGIEATGEVGSLTVIDGDGVIVSLTGVAATGAVGTASVIGDADNIPTTGIAATGSVGSVILNTFQRVPVFASDLFGTGQVGSVTVDADAIVSVTGLSTSASVGSVLVYGNIIPAPGTSWTGVTPNPNTTWTEEQPSPNTTWTEIAA